MKKLLLIALLVVGCDDMFKGDTSVASSVHPLVGIWEGTEVKVTLSGGTQVIFELGENTTMGTVTFIFADDGIMTNISADATVSETSVGTWSTTGNKLTLTSDDVAVVYNFTISGNTLDMSHEGIYEGTEATTELKLIKQ